MKTFEKYASGMYPKNILLWIHFTPFLVSGHDRTPCGAVILNLIWLVLCFNTFAIRGTVYGTI